MAAVDIEDMAKRFEEQFLQDDDLFGSGSDEEEEQVPVPIYQEGSINERIQNEWLESIKMHEERSAIQTAEARKRKETVIVFTGTPSQKEELLKEIMIQYDYQLPIWSAEFDEHLEHRFFDFIIKYSTSKETESKGVEEKPNMPWSSLQKPKGAYSNFFASLKDTPRYKALDDQLRTESKKIKSTDDGEDIDSIYYSWRDFESKLIYRKNNFPPDLVGPVLMINTSDVTETIPLLEQLYPTEENIVALQKTMLDYIQSHDSHYVRKIIDRFMVHWIELRYKGMAKLAEPEREKLIEFEFRWLPLFTDEMDVPRLVKATDMYTRLIKKVTILREEVKILLPEVKAPVFLQPALYYPIEPKGLTLQKINDYLAAAQEPYRLTRDRVKEIFDLDQVTPNTAVLLKPFLVRMIGMVAKKTIIESQLPHDSTTEDELAAAFQTNLNVATQGKLANVLGFLAADVDIKNAIIRGDNECRSFAKTPLPIIPEHQHGMDRRKARMNQAKLHYQTQLKQEPEVSSKCKEACQSVVVRLQSQEMPPEKYIYLGSVEDQFGTLFYRPSPTLQYELCSNEALIRDDGVIIDSMVFVLGKYKEGLVTEFTSVDYYSFQPLQQISIASPYEMFRKLENYSARIVDEMEIEFHKIGWTSMLSTMFETISGLPQLTTYQVLLFFYCVLSFRNPTFQLYSDLLWSKIKQELTKQDTIRYLLNINDSTIMVPRFFDIMFMCTKDTRIGNISGNDVFTYVQQFCNREIHRTFPFFVMNPTAFPYLPTSISMISIESALNKISRVRPPSPNFPPPPPVMEQEPVPVLELDSDGIIPIGNSPVFEPDSEGIVPIGNSPVFYGDSDADSGKKKKKGNRRTKHSCFCGSMEDVIPTIQFDEEGFPHRICVCKSCLDDDMFSVVG